MGRTPRRDRRRDLLGMQKGLRSLMRFILDNAIGGFTWFLASRIAQDVTHDLALGRLLVLAPHPDDETLACGAVIARALANAADVTVVVATDGRYSQDDIDPSRMSEIRRSEFHAATKLLGLPPSQIEWWGFEDSKLSSLHGEMVSRIQRMISLHEPTTVIAPWARDTHPDHAALGQATRAATAASQITRMEYVVWAWTQPRRLVKSTWLNWLQASKTFKSPGLLRFHRPVFVRAESFLIAKSQALACYRSQLGPSAVSIGLPPGVGALDSRFLKRFLRPRELFLRTK